jgi:hypothetical protein
MTCAQSLIQSSCSLLRERASVQVRLRVQCYVVPKAGPLPCLAQKLWIEFEQAIAMFYDLTTKKRPQTMDSTIWYRRYHPRVRPKPALAPPPGTSRSERPIGLLWRHGVVERSGLQVGEAERASFGVLREDEADGTVAEPAGFAIETPLRDLASRAPGRDPVGVERKEVQHHYVQAQVSEVDKPNEREVRHEHGRWDQSAGAMKRGKRPQRDGSSSPSENCPIPLPARADWATALLLILVAVPSFAQLTVPSPGSPGAATVPPSEPTPPADSRAFLDQIGGCVDSGRLNAEMSLQAGRVEAAPGWVLRVTGAPKLTLTAEAAGGRVSRLDMAITEGELLLDGRGLRPHLFLDSIRFEAGKGITEARFRGRGIWRPIVWIFKGLARAALRKLELRTDIPSVMRGDILESKAAATSTDTFLSVVREVHIHDSEFVAFGGRALGFGEMVQFQTALQPETATPLRVAVDRGIFQPGRADQPAQLDIVGRIDGEVENGSTTFAGGRSTFSHGELKKGAFQVRSGDDGKLATTISAAVFALDLTSGQMRLPGGPRVDVETPSRFAIRDLEVRPDGEYSGIVDAELFGKTGAIDRSGTLVSASDVKLRTHGAVIVNGQATGDVDLEFEYRLDYVLVVHYPVEEIGDRRVPLVFQGPFATTLHLQNAGSGDKGIVTGEYQFKVPWPPIEQAALEVLTAKWSEDIPEVIRKVDFVIEPRRFGPCGGNCFLVNVDVTVQKMKAKGFLFRQICHAEGRADLVVDERSRSFLLRNVRIEPRCEGILKWVAKVVAPLLTKTYTDITLFQMPEDLPFTIESVGSGADWLAIAGKVSWASKAAEAASKPTP